jgi:hypothetical protein
MREDAKKRLEYTAATRRNRAKQRHHRTDAKIKEISAQIKADRKAKIERDKEAAVLHKAKNKEIKEQHEME